MYLLPADGEVAIFAEYPIAKHLAREVAEFGIEAELAAELAVERPEHQSEDLCLVVLIRIFAFAIDTAMGEQIRWHKRDPSAQDSKQMTHHLALAVGSYDHKRCLSGRMFHNVEELGAMEEVIARHWRQLHPTIVNLDTIVVHMANLHKKNEIRFN